MRKISSRKGFKSKTFKNHTFLLTAVMFQFSVITLLVTVSLFLMHVYHKKRIKKEENRPTSKPKANPHHPKRKPTRSQKHPNKKDGMTRTMCRSSATCSLLQQRSTTSGRNFNNGKMSWHCYQKHIFGLSSKHISKKRLTKVEYMKSNYDIVRFIQDWQKKEEIQVSWQ